MDKRYDVEQIINSVEQVIKGKRKVIENIVISLLAGGHVLLEDMPGVGKTSLALALANTIGCDFGRIQFTPDTLPSDVVGVSVYDMKNNEFKYVKGPIVNNIVLADELNRTPPKTQASLLEAMEEHQVTVDNKSYKLSEPFMVIATQNPVDYLGTYYLPEAQLDRFFMKLSIGYPSPCDEQLMATEFVNNERWKEIKPVCNAEKIQTMKNQVKKVQVHKDIISYIVEIVNKTRESELFYLGASPRATLALISGAQANAYYNNRDFVKPDDVLDVIYPILSHRLVLTKEATMKNRGVEAELKYIISNTKIPIL